MASEEIDSETVVHDVLVVLNLFGYDESHDVAVGNVLTYRSADEA